MKLSLRRCVGSSLFFLLLMTHLSQQSHDAGCAQRLSVSEDLYGNDSFHVMKFGSAQRKLHMWLRRALPALQAAQRRRRQRSVPRRSPGNARRPRRASVPCWGPPAPARRRSSTSWLAANATPVRC